MAHLVETMAYAGATPWHGLGTRVDDCLTASEMLRAAGLDWDVEKRQVYYLNDEGLPVAADGKFALVRTTDGKALDIAGSYYTPTLNSDAFEFFTEFVEAGGMKMETAGSLDGGRRVWGLAKINDSFTLAGGDRVNGYLLLTNPHKVGESISVKFTAIRVVCNNTITMALGDGRKTFKHRHVTEFTGDKQAMAKVALGLAADRMKDLRDKAEMLAAAEASEEQVLKYVYALAGGKVLDAVIEAAEESRESSGSILDMAMSEYESERRVKVLRRESLSQLGRSIIDSILDSPGSDLESAKGTWWGALNGVTHAVDHKFGKSTDARLTNAWHGTNAALKVKALDLAVQYAGVGR